MAVVCWVHTELILCANLGTCRLTPYDSYALLLFYVSYTLGGQVQLSAEEILTIYAADAGLGPVTAVRSHYKSLAQRFEAGPYLMAPMAGVSDAAWRIMARAGGAALAYSEMVSVAGIHFGGDKTWELALPHAVEPELAVQLFGAQPELFFEAASQLVERLGTKLTLVDINMACPVPKVTRKGEGAALMRTPTLAAEIVEACRQGVEAQARSQGIAAAPVTCKIRRGYSSDAELAPEFAHAMQQAGAAAVAVHGRFADQFYRGEADWSAIARVVAAVDVPVIASGDISDARSAARVRDVTGAAAVMVARGSYANPWIFRDAQRFADTGNVVQHGLHERLAAFRCHIALLAATGAHMVRGRSIAGWYFRGVPEAAMWRERAMHCSDAKEFLSLADTIEAQLA